MAVVVVFVALVAGAVLLALTALSQAGVLHQIILIGMGIVLVDSGLALLVVEVRTYISERAVEPLRTEG